MTISGFLNKFHDYFRIFKRNFMTTSGFLKKFLDYYRIFWRNSMSILEIYDFHSFPSFYDCAWNLYTNEYMYFLVTSIRSRDADQKTDIIGCQRYNGWYQDHNKRYQNVTENPIARLMRKQNRLWKKKKKYLNFSLPLT